MIDVQEAPFTSHHRIAAVVSQPLVAGSRTTGGGRAGAALFTGLTCLASRAIGSAEPALAHAAGGRAAAYTRSGASRVAGGTCAALAACVEWSDPGCAGTAAV